MSKISPTFEEINKLLGVKEAYRAPDALMKILFQPNKRVEFFQALLELYDYEVNYDWFHDYFQEAQADRKNFKQDFTPISLARLLAEVVEPTQGNNLDVAAGTGGLTISKWDADRKKESPFTYKPSNYYYQCEELSERALPFLLSNLMIRGMNAVVLSGDSLSRKFTGIFFIQNEENDMLDFSSLNIVPNSKGLRDFLMISEYENQYPEYVESEEIPKHLQGVIK